MNNRILVFEWTPCIEIDIHEEIDTENEGAIVDFEIHNDEDVEIHDNQNMITDDENDSLTSESTSGHEDSLHDKESPEEVLPFVEPSKMTLSMETVMQQMNTFWKKMKMKNPTGMVPF